jgi:hypothetical protein
MSKGEMRRILSEHLAKYRTWSYAQLAEKIGRDPFWKPQDCLEHVEGTASDGTKYQVELNVFWNDKSNGEIIVSGDLSADPQRPLLGFIPIYTSDVTDSFIMSAEGQIVAEHGKRVA